MDDKDRNDNQVQRDEPRYFEKKRYLHIFEETGPSGKQPCDQKTGQNKGYIKWKIGENKSDGMGVRAKIEGPDRARKQALGQLNPVPQYDCQQANTKCERNPGGRNKLLEPSGKPR
jgi:hypothetical protein